VILRLLGREVATVLDKAMEAGQHAATWEAGGLPSGVYLYRLEAGDFVETRQLVFLKQAGITMGYKGFLRLLGGTLVILSVVSAPAVETGCDSGSGCDEVGDKCRSTTCCPGLVCAHNLIDPDLHICKDCTPGEDIFCDPIGGN
jgi:hypothetical protein